MIIKKYIGKNEEEAVESAKKELGNGVVIMNVKQVNASGVLGFLKAKRTEVTVALEEERDIQARQPVQPDLSAVRQAAAMTGPQPGNVGIEKKLDSLQTLLEKQLEADRKRENPAARAMETGTVSEQKPEEDLSAETEYEGKPEEADCSEQDKFIRLLYNTMIDNDVNEQFADQFLQDMEKNKKPNLPIDNILAAVYQKMVLKFGKSEEISPSASGPKLVLFLGPTGVGKTTTIAKLASRYAMEEKKKVALLTSDTYRIAAAEQLHTYADILEVPFGVIYTAEEFNRICKERFANFDYIFVDTAGHSHQNKEQLEDMEQFIKAIPENMNYQCFLVLSATTKYSDLLRITKTYKEITDYQLIFTKLDETDTLGTLLKVRLTTDTPIAYVTYGQNVPDDIEKFNPQRTVKQLLGGKS